MAETFTYQPTKNSPKSKAPRTKGIAFGNGYQQVYGDGLNANLESWSLEFTEDDADKQLIETFFDEHGGYQFFNWTSPESGAVQKQYLCPSWHSLPVGGGYYRITAVFKEWAGLV